MKGTALGAAVVLAALALAACDDDGGPNGPPTDACGNRCLVDLGEVCNELTGLCEFQRPDAGDAGDVRPDTPDQSDEGEDDVEAGGCGGDEECPNAQYCNEAGVCTPGCRSGDNDNCENCSLFPQTCQSGLQCHPIDHQCVGGCVDDDECPLSQFCNLDNGLCEEGCRAEPDNCIDITGSNTYVCDEGTHACIGGPCEDDDGCDLGAFCDVAVDDVCVWGCRTNPDNCGSGERCDEVTRTCGPRTCACAGGQSNEECDAQCDNPGGGTSAYYCDALDELCELGCRIRDDGTDTCRPGTICDDDTRQCVAGCNIDETCPFLTYCEDDECVPGCKAGECDAPDFCDLDSRACLSQVCSGDDECPEGTYCGAGDVCLDGCRLDDPDTGEIDEETCAGELVCDVDTRGCIIATCEEHGDCPLREYCNVGGDCIPGCSGMSDRCPVGEPCSAVNGFCGCTREADCAANQHCDAPVCVLDCTPDDPALPGDQDTCPGGLTCDPASGRCVGGCIDTEPSGRNDTPDTATCALFVEADLSDASQIALCRAGETHLPPDSFCGDEESSFCLNATACTGGDFDWYAMYLYAGEEISFFAHYGTPEATTFVLELVSADNPSVRLRGATATGTGVGTATPFVITETNQYLLRAFAIEAQAVPYELEVRVERVFACRDDLFEPNGNPNGSAPEIENSEIEQSFPNLAICEADRDFFAIDLFAGNQITAIVDPQQDDAALQLNLGTANAGQTDLDPTTGGGDVNIPATAYSDPEDAADPNDVIIDGTPIPFTDRYFLRVRSIDPAAESFYDMGVLTERGSASCVSTAFEPNDEADPDGFPASAEYRVRDSGDLPNGRAFPNARLCPEDGADPADVDYYMVVVHADVADGFLTAELVEHGSDADRLAMEMFRWTEGGLVAVDVGGEPENRITSEDGEMPAGTYFVRVAANEDGPGMSWQGVGYDLELGYSLALCSDDGLEPNDSPGTARRLHTSVLLGETECNPGQLGSCTADTPGNPPLCLCHDRSALTICPGDADWYLIRLLQGDSFSIRITPIGGAATDLTAILWPVAPDCTPDDFGDCEDLTPFSISGGTLRVINQAANPLPSGIIREYYISVENNTGNPVSYTIHSEVLGEDNRNCPADPWDADFDDYSIADDAGPCLLASCTMSLDPNNDFRSGNICYWDQQDVFRFTLTEATDLQVLVEYFVDEGRIDGDLSGGAIVGDVDLEERDGQHGDPEGIEWVFPDLAAGTYQIELFMPGRGTGLFGSSPNDYTVSIDDVICNDGIWSMNEACDPTSSASPATMCGAGDSCNASCVCVD